MHEAHGGVGGDAVLAGDLGDREAAVQGDGGGGVVTRGELGGGEGDERLGEQGGIVEAFGLGDDVEGDLAGAGVMTGSHDTMAPLLTADVSRSDAEFTFVTASRNLDGLLELRDHDALHKDEGLAASIADRMHARSAEDPAYRRWVADAQAQQAAVRLELGDPTAAAALVRDSVAAYGAMYDVRPDVQSLLDYKEALERGLELISRSEVLARQVAGDEWQRRLSRLSVLQAYMAKIPGERPIPLLEALGGPGFDAMAEIGRCKRSDWSYGPCMRVLPKAGLEWIRWRCRHGAQPRGFNPFCTQLAGLLYRGVGGPEEPALAVDLFDRQCRADVPERRQHCRAAAEVTMFAEPERALAFAEQGCDAAADGPPGCAALTAALAAGSSRAPSKSSRSRASAASPAGAPAGCGCGQASRGTAACGWRAASRWSMARAA